MKALFRAGVALWITLSGAGAQDFDVSLSLGDDDTSRSAIRQKLREIVIPQLEFQDTPLEDAIEFLRLKATELEIEPSGERWGVSIVIKDSPGLAAPFSLDDEKAFAFSNSPTITLKLSNVSLLDALRYIAGHAGREVRIEPYGVVLAPLTADVASLVPSIEDSVRELAAASGRRLYEGDHWDDHPPRLLEALQSEYRVLRHKEERLIDQGAGVDDPRRAALNKKLEATRRRIAEARDLLVDYRRKEKDLAKKWIAETAE